MIRMSGRYVMRERLGSLDDTDKCIWTARVYDIARKTTYCKERKEKKVIIIHLGQYNFCISTFGPSP